jgi:hypothetical protein
MRWGLGRNYSVRLLLQNQPILSEALRIFNPEGTMPCVLLRVEPSVVMNTVEKLSKSKRHGCVCSVKEY